MLRFANNYIWALTETLRLADLTQDKSGKEMLLPSSYLGAAAPPSLGSDAGSWLSSSSPQSMSVSSPGSPATSEDYCYGAASEVLYSFHTELVHNIASTTSYHECTVRAGRAQSRVTRFHLALGLAAALLIVSAGLAVYIAVLKGSQGSEQTQTKEAQKSSSETGKDGEVLPPCGEDWIWYRNKCYIFSEAEGTWTEAKDSCVALNSTLALIDTQKELDFMLRYKGDRHHWIGLQRETDKPWKWVDGTEFSNWFAVEDFSECAYLNHARVKSAECYSKRNWICTKVAAYEPKRKKNP
ncbi:killer cell lectin-like receptor subfamily B member 1B allele B [Lissotriton helveticus]